MTWFVDLTGIDEASPQQVRDALHIDEDCIVCPNGKRIAFGHLETSKLADLRQRAAEANAPRGTARLREVVADVTRLHIDDTNAGALFQVASQFNLLEMAAPSVTPEHGVGVYEFDHTQGPACAIACGAGTIYRNYFAPVNGSVGQTADRQIDCSFDLGRRLGGPDQTLWSMRNGYLFPSDQGLNEITSRLRSADDAEREQLRGELRIGLQWNAQVTIGAADHRVSQAYCSALPVAYGSQPESQWTDFATLVLQAAYEATLCAAILNAEATGVNTVYLTLLGGGVFGNRDQWIIEAIERAVDAVPQCDLDVAVVSYGSSKPAVAELVRRHR